MFVDTCRERKVPEIKRRAKSSDNQKKQKKVAHHNLYHSWRVLPEDGALRLRVQRRVQAKHNEALAIAERARLREQVAQLPDLHHAWEEHQDAADLHPLLLAGAPSAAD
eukprot:COSAG06_NODE_1735_length_8524_cov_23.310623_7_plen_109_part_00